VTQQANLMAGKRSAPVWALAAILFLGWNEFMAVLWNPVYLILGAAMFLFGWQLYGELDVDAEMQRGPMVGLFNMWNKLGDGLRNVSSLGRASLCLQSKGLWLTGGNGCLRAARNAVRGVESAAWQAGDDAARTGVEISVGLCCSA
jgi:hypothetical protein